MSNSTSAPGKAILIGEHAVVYGAPAIAIPLPQIRAKAYIKASAQSLTITPADLARPPLQLGGGTLDLSDPLAKMADLILQHLNRPRLCGEITIKSEIPIASGLGSGAAVSAALGRAIAALQGVRIGDEILNTLVYEVEKLHHGMPSGIDNTVVVYEKPVYFIKTKTMQFIHFGEPLHILVADTGIAALTRAAVIDVRALYQRQPQQTEAIFEKIAIIAENAKDCIQKGELTGLGELMTSNHELLQALTVSSAELDRLVEAALSAGALGAKLSGGGRGGNIIALVDESSVSIVEDSLLSAGARRVFATQVGGRNETQ